jgi:hypothetical protein
VGEVNFTSHPPERRRRGTVLLQGGCCSSCCCCCVHSAGGVLGAIYGSLRRGAPSPEAETPADATRKKAVRLTVKAYWLSFAVVTTVSLFIATLSNPEELIFGPIIIGFCLPVCQLVASLATWVFLISKDRPRECYRRLGRITLLAFIGGVVGTLGTWLTIANR